MRIGLSELLLIIVLVLILFGAGKFPKIMENFAEGIKVFKKSMNENDDETIFHHKSNCFFKKKNCKVIKNKK